MMSIFMMCDPDTGAKSSLWVNRHLPEQPMQPQLSETWLSFRFVPGVVFGHQDLEWASETC